MANPAKNFLGTLPSSLRSACKRYLPRGHRESSTGQLDIAHMPWEGSEAYAFTIFPPITGSKLNKYAKLHSLSIPPKYKTILQTFNGLFAFDLSLFGIPESMLADPPLLDRSVQQCHDLSTANRYWMQEYAVDDSLFHFGSRAFSEDANTGYFLDSKGWILSYLEDGTRVGRWKSFESFLKAELLEAEEMVRDDFPNDWCT